MAAKKSGLGVSAAVAGVNFDWWIGRNLHSSLRCGKDPFRRWSIIGWKGIPDIAGLGRHRSSKDSLSDGIASR
jgi:hypothetical protein